MRHPSERGGGDQRVVEARAPSAVGGWLVVGCWSGVGGEGPPAATVPCTVGMNRRSLRNEHK
jgi:hypothetical protein